jgi:hypothetical protein
MPPYVLLDTQEFRRKAGKEKKIHEDGARGLSRTWKRAAIVAALLP